MEASSAVVDYVAQLPAAAMAALLVVVLLAAQWVWMMWVARDGMPGPVPIPLLGTMTPWNGFAGPSVFHKSVMGSVKRYGPVHRIWAGSDPLMIVGDPAQLQRVLVSSMEVFDRSKKEIDRFSELLRGGIILEPNGPGWRRQRQGLAPAFRHEALQRMVPVLAGNAVRMARRMAGAAVAAPDGAVDVVAEAWRITFDTICHIAMGCEFPPPPGSPPGTRSEELVAFDEACEHCQWRYFMPLAYWKLWRSPGERRYLAAVAKLHQAVEDEIDARQAGKGSGDGSDVLTHLLKDWKTESGKWMTRRDVVQQVITLLFAGHDTTACMLAYAMYYLAKYPDVQRRAAAEVLDALGPLDESTRGAEGKGQEGGDVGVDAKLSLPYVTAIIQETLRLRPSVPGRSRELTEDTELAGYKAKKGDHFVFTPLAIHLNEDLWPDPLRFDPERFMPGAPRRHALAYVPFGAGKRRCLGENMALLEGRIVLATMLRRFDLELAPGECHGAEDVMALTLKPGGPIRLVLKPRGKSE